MPIDTMQVDIYDVEQGATKTLPQRGRTIYQRNVDLREALGDDADECLPALLTDLERNGFAMFGGGASPLYEIKPVAMSDRRREFDDKVSKAIDRAEAALKPLFDPAYRLLEPWEMEILHELMFKLDCARSIIVHRDMLPAAAEQNWQETKARKTQRLAQHRAG